MPSVYVKAYGCSANLADSEIAKGILHDNGFDIRSNIDSSDVNLILTCIVKTPTEQKILKEIKRLMDTGTPLIIAGCMPKAMLQKAKEFAPPASLVGPNDIEKIAEAVNLTLQGYSVVYVDGRPTDRTCYPRIRKNKIIHIAPISSGCLGNCSYCIVKSARGELFSFPVDNIVHDARLALDFGCKEIWVTAEDTAAYYDNGEMLPDLLGKLSQIPGDFRIRVGMMTPNQLILIKSELIKTFNHEKIYKFIHIPVQSGNNIILRRMNRQYTVEDFKNIVSCIRTHFPSISISTDIICGFPGETPEQFQDSINLIRDINPDVLNISRFWGRPGTAASLMEGRLHGRETKARSRRLTSLWKKIALEVGEKWLGWTGKVLINEKGKNETMVGRNFAYKTVVTNDDVKLGDWVQVKVTGVGIGFLRAKIV
jgi:MiaB-like tRNA modifying enzyme